MVIHFDKKVVWLSENIRSRQTVKSVMWHLVNKKSLYFFQTDLNMKTKLPKQALLSQWHQLYGVQAL